MTTAIDRFLTGLTDPSAQTIDVYAPDAVLDATVPNWRFRQCGADAFAAQVRHWFRDPAAFEEISRTPLPDGELVEFTLTWEENGVPHAAHQAHRLTVDGDRIAHDVMFCGGRWPAPLLAEMAEADA
jgi:hypothetical protein